MRYCGTLACCVLQHLFFYLRVKFIFCAVEVPDAKRLVFLMLQHSGAKHPVHRLISTTLNLSQAQAPESAMSLAVPGRPIGRANGQDRASPDHFAKKPPPYLVKLIRSPVTSHRKFFEKTLRL
jgi:hypothetical protein